MSIGSRGTRWSASRIAAAVPPARAPSSPARYSARWESRRLVQRSKTCGSNAVREKKLPIDREMASMNPR
nr:hypothetical protein [uncultured Actinoplanes sp.]